MKKTTSKSIQNKYFLALLFILFSINSFGQNYNYDQGIDFYKKEDYREAIECFSKAIDQEPKNGLYYYFRATCFDYLDEKTSALKDINSAINYFSKKEKIEFAEAFEFRGDIYNYFEEYNKAIDDYTEGIRIKPTNLDFYFNRANVYFNLKKYSLSEADYKKILSIDESSVRAYAGLSRTSLENDKIVDAEAYANKAIKMNPDYSGGYVYRGNVYLKKKEYESAIDDYITYYILSDFDEYGKNSILYIAHHNYTYTITKLSSKINSVKYPQYLIGLRAEINEAIGNYSEAIKDYNTLLETAEEEDKIRLHFLKAKCFLWMDLPTPMLNELNKALEYDSTAAVLLGYKGIAYNLLKENKMAENCYDMAIKKDGEISWFYSYRAQNKIDQGKYEPALADFNMAIAIDKSNILTYYNRALLYKDYLKQNEKANKDFQFVIDNDTDATSGINKRQFAFFYLNDKTKAINWQNEILKENPTFSEFYDAAKFNSLINEKNKSIEYLNNAIEKGFRKVSDLEKDQEFRNINNSLEYKKIVSDLKAQINTELNYYTSNNDVQIVDSVNKVSIPLKSKGSGTYEVSCAINKLKLNMIFDTGASVISISQTEVDFMIKNGYLTENDMIGNSNYMDANGDVEIGTTINLREVDFGGLILRNVKASVVHNKNAPLLFGQSALGKYGQITIDNTNKTLTISK
jgi:clan AA aspartic protease (TIGR02281 family)